MTELETRIERIEAELGIDSPNDLPQFHGYQMAEKVATVKGLTVYRDWDGDAWIQFPDGTATVFAEDAHGGRLIEAIEEANR